MSPFSLIFLSICLLFTSTLASPTPHPPWAHKPAYFLLAGDSTTATQSANGGGWGDGFLNHTLAYPSSGKNYGHNGATTKSFREGGDWGRLIGEAKMKIREGWDVFVTVQFGHNDQKNTSGVSLAQYKHSLEAFATEVQGLGAVPILITPLTRRNYASTTPPSIIQDLAVQRNLTVSAALATKSRYIDLNAKSVWYCNVIGPEAAWGYDLKAGDHTHLDWWGSVVFGRMVSGLMQGWVDVRGVTRGDGKLSMEIREGVPA